LQEPVDGADEVALEGSEGFAAGLAFGLFATEERLGRGVVASFVEHEAIERAVELAVAAGVQAVAVGASGDAGIGAAADSRASLASLAKRPMPAISPISLAAVSVPQPGSAASRGAKVATSAASSCSSVVIARVSSRMRLSSSRRL
jgi:hypothetical protein